MHYTQKIMMRREMRLPLKALPDIHLPAFGAQRSGKSGGERRGVELDHQSFCLGGRRTA